MEIGRIIDLAARLNLPGILIQGAEFVAAVRDNAALAEAVLTDGDWAELDAIHARALAAAEKLDGQLAAAEKR